MPAQRAHFVRYLVADVVCVERCDSYGAATERARQLLLGGKTALVSIYDGDPRKDPAARPVATRLG